ncbi:Lysine-specific demethylase 9 [Bienertia sinuspersici]
MDTSWIDLRNDDPAFYEGCKAFVEIAKETSIEGNTRCPCNKCKLNKWFPLEEGQDKEKDKEKEADLDDMGGLLREALGVHIPQSAFESEGYISDSNSEEHQLDEIKEDFFDAYELKPALDEFISQKWKENQFEQSRVLENIENEWTINEYADWLRSQAHNLDDSTVEGKLRKALAGGLSNQAMAMKSVFINGYKFDIVDHSHAANDACQGPPKKTSMSISTTPLHNVASQPQKEVSKLSPTLQNQKLNSGRWGPFTPPPLNTTKTLQSAHEMSKNVEPTKPSSGIWKKSPSGLVEPQKSEEIVSQQSLKVEKRQEQAVELSNLPPMAPKNGQSSKATNSLRQNAFSSSPYPVQKNQEVASQQSLRVEDKPEFDDTVDVVTIDAKGNHSLVSGSIQAVDIWNNNGVRYYVQFNEFHQPIRKGGQLLVKLIGSIAKQERFCPVGELDWHHIDDVLLADMINEIRDRFVIPDGEIYINKILSRIAKVWRQYKSHLKSLYFKPQEKSQEEHYNSIPCGISRDNWRKLVKYWFSEKGQVMQYMSECGKEARASQCHIHISGGKSFANIRADYEDKHGEEMSLVELYEDVHMRKDGSFIEGTQAQDFLEDAKAKTDILAETDGSKSRKEVENEVFESLMYGGSLLNGLGVLDLEL